MVFRYAALISSFLFLNGSTVQVAFSAQPGGFNNGLFPNPIRFGQQPYKPMSYMENGVSKGIHAEFRKDLMAEAGLAHTEHYMPLSRLYHSLKKGQSGVHTWLTIEMPETYKLGYPVRPTIFFPVRLNLFALAGTRPPTFDEFAAERLITIIGFKYGGMLDRLKKRVPGLTVLQAHNHIAAFRMLKAKRAKYVLNYLLPGLDAAKDGKVGALAHTELMQQPTLMFVSKNVSNAQALVHRLSDASKRILARREKSDANKDSAQ